MSEPGRGRQRRRHRDRRAAPRAGWAEVAGEVQLSSTETSALLVVDRRPPRAEVMPAAELVRFEPRLPPPPSASRPRSWATARAITRAARCGPARDTSAAAAAISEPP